MKTFGQHLKNLLSAKKDVPQGGALQALIDGVLSTAAEIFSVVQVAQEQGISIQEATYSGATPNIEFINSANFAYLDAAIAFYEKNVAPEQAAKLAEFKEYVAQLDTKIQIAKQPTAQKANIAAIKGIQLNTRGEFIVKDAKIKGIADNFAKRFGLKPIWARNLIGMFDISVPHEDRVKFLEACNKGEALDISAMIKKGQGSVEDVVTTKIPKVKQVFSSIKETLLDISLSTGQRGATGPFEALVAIMGGARKPTAEEGGDLVVNVGGKDLKLELKAGSLSPTSKRNKDGSLPNTGKANAAWLDSTAGKEVSGSTLRIVGDDWLRENVPEMSAQLNKLWSVSDFRPTGLDSLSKFLEQIEKLKKGSSARLIGFMMLSMFPSCGDAKGYDFKTALKHILQAINTGDSVTIAREQGIMALIEYALGKGNDGFLFFNSSTQEYKMVMGVKGILKLHADSQSDPNTSAVRFTNTMTMKRGAAKCSPGVYFGPDATSNRAKTYFAEYNADPARVAMRATAEANGDKEFDDGAPAQAAVSTTATTRARREQPIQTPRQRRT